jgi:hypothetical protein
MIINDVNPPIEDVISHFGTKGMKWGVRRQQRKDRNAQIKTARRSIAAKEHEINNLDRQSRKAKTSAERSRLDKLATKKAADLFNHPDHLTASRMTSGEKWANGLLIGGSIAVAGAAGAARAF